MTEPRRRAIPSSAVRRKTGQAALAALLSIVAWGCTNADDQAEPTTTTQSGDPATGGGSGPSGGGNGAAGSTTTAFVTTAPPDAAMGLLEFYGKVLGAEESLAKCYAEAAQAQGLATVADLEAAEAKPEVAAALSAALDACTAKD